ncbi:serine/threonine-protein kinase [Corynebacterium sp. p3-SID1056]|uniref:serine/threonine-protein kinase n=1 Tax=Corynebacterium sp. p3-SID1056 TaxID=2916092 RepID=UPI0021A876DF|nr:serine/threonine-protein kinase [Corynebacterium sp. p3-SID1056]MCT2338141.1 serine/threonine protein kinase [Corynebacterium sp. p3-SID1056]
MNTENREELQKLIGDDYQLQWVIGHGGMSTVWLADDPENDREVALKVLRPEFSSNDEFLARFRNEALAAEGINSPNVVATYDYRELESPSGAAMCFIVMEYIRGESLADLIKREGALDEELALDVLEQAAHGLAVIHRMGLVHRDIKPGNLMITQNGQIKITDFGIAKAAAAVPLTRTGMVVGTAQYVSPEQAQGMKVSAASDVYSLGVVGYEMLAGARPFTGDSSVSVALAHVSAEPPALPISVSAPARELIEIALRKDPRQRFRDGNEMQLAVEQVRQGLRPAQPGGQTAVIATEPSPTESTQMLADVAEERTTRPAGAYPPSAARAVASRRPPAPPAPASSRAGGYRETAPAPQEKKPSKAGPIVAGLLALLLVGGIAAWAATSGVLDGVLGGSKTSTPTQPSVVTQTETVESTPSEEEEEPETVTRSRETVTREVEEPETLTFSEENTPEPEQSTHQSTSAAHSPTRASTSAASEPTTEQSQPAAPSETGGAGNGAGEIELPDVEEILGGNAQ